MERKLILVIDDDGINLRRANEILSKEYSVKVANSCEMALKVMKQCEPDIILLDIDMPVHDGFYTYKAIRALGGAAESIPIIFLTGKNSTENEVECLKMGAVDFVTKPVIPETMLLRIRVQLELFDYRRSLEYMVIEKTREIQRIQQALAASLTDLIEVRDGSTGGHSKRVMEYTKILLKGIKESHMFNDVVNAVYIDTVERAAILHDIGKVGVVDKILLGGKFDPDDVDSIERMRAHASLGAKILGSALEQVGGTNEFLKKAYEIALSHHERWDGTGYPNGLAGEEIPLSARIVAVADVYDALTSRRSYKEPFSHETACEIIIQDAGTAFDPDIVKVFEKKQDEFDLIRKEYLE